MYKIKEYINKSEDEMFQFEIGNELGVEVEKNKKIHKIKYLNQITKELNKKYSDSNNKVQ